MFNLRWVYKCAILALATLWLATPGTGDSHSFGGFYDVQNLDDLGTDVRFDFRVRIFNYTGADVTGATVVLSEAIDVTKVSETFPAVSILSGGSTFLKATVIVPAEDYGFWSQYGEPNLRIEFTDTHGDWHRDAIQSLRVPLGEEN